MISIVDLFYEQDNIQCPLDTALKAGEDVKLYKQGPGRRYAGRGRGGNNKIEGFGGRFGGGPGKGIGINGAFGRSKKPEITLKPDGTIKSDVPEK
ncbi:MAG: hypothetical protein WC188_04535 [Candidatus Caldatribacteriota bacterium]|nr:hypothetical protein [Patescibacteria group bacterium]